METMENALKKRNLTVYDFQYALQHCSLKDYGIMSLHTFCQNLSISVATGRNWIRLKKIEPLFSYQNSFYFSVEYFEMFQKSLLKETNLLLKNGRNKKFISGNSLYKSYLSAQSKNAKVIMELIDTLEQENVFITDQVILFLLVQCAVELLSSFEGISYNVFDYIEGYTSSPYYFLIDDFQIDRGELFSFFHKHPSLLKTYYYEPFEDVLGFLYISLKNLGERKAMGSYFTPTKIVKKMLNQLFSMNSCSCKTVFDPCCGTGNFLLQLPEEIPFSNVYGNDIDSISVKITRISYALKYQIQNPTIIYSHITNINYLWDDSFMSFDFVVTNPPWGYLYSSEEKMYLRSRYLSVTGANVESFDVFIERALSSLKPGGVFSFVIPESFLNVKAHLPIRHLLKNHSIQYLEFLGNAFDQVQCPSIILQVIKDEPFHTTGMIVRDKKREFVIQKEREFTLEYFSFWMDDNEEDVIRKMENVSSKVTLFENATFALGIVTGNNKKFLSSTKEFQNEIVLKGANLLKYRIMSEHASYLSFKPQLFQQVSSEAIYRAEEKLLYRFVSNQLVFSYDNKQTLSLNSANILIPKVEGLDIKYILALLNSRPMQFYFKKKFHSVKVLKSHIESFPIPFIDLKKQKSIISLVDKLLVETDSKVIYNFYNQIDECVCLLFGLTKKEYSIILASMENENLFLD